MAQHWRTPHREPGERERNRNLAMCACLAIAIIVLAQAIRGLGQ